VRQEEGCLKLNLYSNLLGWHLLTDLQTLALLKSQVVAHKELVRIFTQKLQSQTNIKILTSLDSILGILVHFSHLLG
jgi:hypothetical protein